jgi:hypothetical protein
MYRSRPAPRAYALYPYALSSTSATLLAAADLAAQLTPD